MAILRLRAGRLHRVRRCESTGIQSLIWVLSCLAMTGCGPGQQGADRSDRADREAAVMHRVTGNLAYRERIALPPGTVAQVRLLDVSIADTASPVIGEQTIALESRQVPVDFEILVPPDQLEANRRYAVRGTLQDAEGQLRWTTDTAYPVDPVQQTQDLGTLMLVRVASPATSDALVGVEWVVEDIAGRGVVDIARATLNFDAQGRIWGLGSCNSYTGSYTRDGDELSTGPLAVTGKACPEALMRQEDALLAILGDASRIEWSDEGALIVVSSSGEKILARRQ